MYCSSCGSQVKPGSRFCPTCGAALDGQDGIEGSPFSGEQVDAPVSQAPAAKSKPLILAVIALAALAVAACALCIVLLLGSSTEGSSSGADDEVAEVQAGGSEEASEEDADAAGSEAESTTEEESATAESGSSTDVEHSYETSYFYVDVPDSWDEYSWSVTVESDGTYSFTVVVDVDYTGGATVYVLSASEDAPSGSVVVGTTSDGYVVYFSNAGAGFFNDEYLSDAADIAVK